MFITLLFWNSTVSYCGRFLQANDIRIISMCHKTADSIFFLVTFCYIFLYIFNFFIDVNESFDFVLYLFLCFDSARHYLVALITGLVCQYFQLIFAIEISCFNIYIYMYVFFYVCTITQRFVFSYICQYLLYCLFIWNI